MIVFLHSAILIVFLHSAILFLSLLLLCLGPNSCPITSIVAPCQATRLSIHPRNPNLLFATTALVLRYPQQLSPIALPLSIFFSEFPLLLRLATTERCWPTRFQYGAFSRGRSCFCPEYLYVHQFEVVVSCREWSNQFEGSRNPNKTYITFPEFIKLEVEMVSELVITAPPVKEVELVAISTKLENSVIGYTLTMNVDYPSEALACIVKTTLAVDPELQPDKVQREMLVQGARLSVTFTAVEARFLRASFSAFMELLILATRTVEQFGPASSYGQYCHM